MDENIYVAKNQYDKKYNSGNVKIPIVFSAIKEDYTGAEEFGKILFDMCTLEAELEKKRWELVMSEDFNTCDTFVMFGALRNLYENPRKMGKMGIDSDDLFDMMINNLNLAITRDEMFIMFYKLDFDGDGLISYEELTKSFMPRSSEYAHLLTTRGRFYQNEKNTKRFFRRNTR